jgi:hypothetical protein
MTCPPAARALLVVLVLAGCTSTSSGQATSQGQGSGSSTTSTQTGTSTSEPVPPLATTQFRTPSGNIGCLYALKQLRCDIRSGLVPESTRYRCPSDSHWAGINLSYRGALPNCASDTVVNPTSPVLSYEAGWERGGYTCVSRSTGLNCMDGSDRGFTLAREGWTTFEQGGDVLTTDMFQTPSGNIVCAHIPRSIRCDLHSGLVPEPQASCPLDWVGVWLDSNGTAGPNCAGDSVPTEAVQVLPYGHTWRLGGITCSSDETGLTCKNGRGHGFFLSKAAWRTD